MKSSRLWQAATIIAVIIIVGFVISVPHTTRDTVQAPEEIVAAVPTVTLRDAYKKGTHTVSGSLEAPNACATVFAEATYAPGAASSTGSILVALTLADDGGVCLQVPERMTFSTTVSAPVDLPIVATVNGETASTNMQ